MTRYTYTPQSWSVFNELDRHGLFLGLPRLKDERNPEYKKRLFDVMVNQADSTFQGLINGITRELGLSIFNAIQINHVLDVDGNFILSLPAIIFNETKCFVYSDLANLTLLDTYDRFEISDNAWTISQLGTRLEDTGYFTISYPEGSEPSKKSMTIFNQSTAITVPKETLANNIVIRLDNRNLVEGTISIRSATLFNRVYNDIEVVHAGDYYIDLINGVIYSYSPAGPGSTIRYQYINESYIAKASPVIIHNLQSEDFQTKMFEQIESEDEYINGLPTALGADIINELLSVYGILWNK